MQTLDHLPVTSGYFDMFITDPDSVIQRARTRLANVDFDTFVATGLSGAVVAPILARELGKHFLIVRKADDHSTHSSKRGVGRLGKRWIFVDDLVSSGNTRRHVKESVDRFLRELADNGGSMYVPGDALPGVGYGRYVDFPDFRTQYVGDYLYTMWEDGAEVRGAFFDGGYGGGTW